MPKTDHWSAPLPVLYSAPCWTSCPCARAVDTAGPNAFPHGFSWSCANRGHFIHSCLDRIYIPSQSWSARLPVSIPTNWSDHKLIWADCSILAPRVELAVPAPRLPDIDSLSKDSCFWSAVMAGYDILVSSPVTLESWTTFKSLVLSEGVRSKSLRRHKKTKDWKAALRGDLVHEDDLHQAIHDALCPSCSSKAPSLPPQSCRWQSVLPDHMLPSPVSKHLPHCATCWGDVSDPSPHSWTYKLPGYVSILDLGPWPPDPVGPWFPALVPAPQRSVADLLDSCVSLRRAATLRKYHGMVDSHSSAWFKLSSNKEADERGSHASVSVDGLHCSTSDVASTSLPTMLPIAQSYFTDLHTPIPADPSRSVLQRSLLDEVRDAYGALPSPAPIIGPFSLPEVCALRPKMHNTAPGPDGIQNGFWKALAARIDSLEGTAMPPLSFWEAFRELTDDLRSHGTSRCHFKDANLSLFFKKGDPTLVANYRPISSMNTDCNTNLVNSHLAPWAISKLHQDQKGFVPGRLITEHT